MSSKYKYGVLGGGSWATAIVKMLCENLDDVGWYMRSIYAKEHLLKHRHNPNYLSSVEFNLDKLKLSNEIDEIVDHADILIVAIPSAFVYREFEKVTKDIKSKIIVSAVKGIIPESGLLVGEHFHDIYNIPFNHIAVIAGPCHSEEVALERLSYLTICSADPDMAREIAGNLSSSYINTTISDDVKGVEYAVMLKNIYAIAAGIAHGLGYGDNFLSVLMSNAIREMKRFIKKMHKMKRNINGSAYLGDLLVTGYSVFSRNRMFGNMIGKGYTVKSAMMEMNMVAEGYYATKSAKILNDKNKKKTRLPIIAAVYAILYEGKDAKTEFEKLTEKLD